MRKAASSKSTTPWRGCSGGRNRRLAGSDCTTLFGTLPAERQPFMRALRSRQRENAELEIDGRRLNIVVDPIFESGGQPAGAVHIVSDVTEQSSIGGTVPRGAEVRIGGNARGGRSARFQQFAYEHHGQCKPGAGRFESDHPFHSRLQDVVAASQRAADLTRQLLAYSGKGRHFLQKVDLSALLRGMGGPD